MHTMRRLLGIVFLVTVGAIVSAPIAAAAETPCVTAAVDASIVLPDGSVHPGGALTVCEIRAISPVANFHRISIDGRAVGMFVSRKVASEVEEDAAPTILFQDGGSGELALVGYVVPSRRSAAFRLADRTVETARRGTVTGAAVAVVATAR